LIAAAALAVLAAIGANIDEEEEFEEATASAVTACAGDDAFAPVGRGVSFGPQNPALDRQFEAGAPAAFQDLLEARAIQGPGRTNGVVVAVPIGEDLPFEEFQAGVESELGEDSTTTAELGDGTELLAGRGPEDNPIGILQAGCHGYVLFGASDDDVSQFAEAIAAAR
jgi:hypothetical protein